MLIQKLLLLTSLLVLIACDDSRPARDELLPDPVFIEAVASVDGVTLLPGGATGNSAVTINGTMQNEHGVASASYSWNEGATAPISLNADGEFEIDITLTDGTGSVELQATSLLDGELSTLSMSFYLDQAPPVVTLPEASFAATITSESDMTMDKQLLSFTLTGGSTVAVIDGVSYSKYSTTYGANQENLPLWRFKLEDDQPLTDARLEFRVVQEDSEEELTEIVPWTVASSAGEAVYEVLITSELNESLATESGDFILEVQAYDGANNATEVARVAWTQAILNPPIYIQTGSEDIMGNAMGPRDPRSYILGDNFSDLRNTSGLIVGSLVVGNPSDVPVFIKLEPLFEPRASWGAERTWTALGLDVAGPRNPCGGEGTDITIYSQDGLDESCYGTLPWGGSNLRERDVSDFRNTLPGFEIRNVGGDVIATDASFVLPGNTEAHVMVILENPVGNTIADSRDFAQLGPYWQGVTVVPVNDIYVCSAPSLGCNQWDSAMDLLRVKQYYAEWPFTAKVQSKVNFDVNDSTEWLPADPVTVTGYSRTHSTSESAPLPTSLTDIAL